MVESIDILMGGWMDGWIKGGKEREMDTMVKHYLQKYEVGSDRKQICFNIKLQVCYKIRKLPIISTVAITQ